VRRAGLILLATGLGLVGCLERVDVQALRYRCASHADCGDGRYCDPMARVCVASLPDVAPDEVDALEPDRMEPEPEPVLEPAAEPVAEPTREVVEATEVEAACDDGAPCDDGDPCTRDDSCVAGVCVGQVSTTDATCDATDDDCDGLPDDDYVPEPLACGLGACAAVGATTCVAGHVLMQCHPGTPTTEICNGVDDDCDGLTDAADGADVAACDGDGDGHCAGVGPDPGPAACPLGLDDCDDAHAAAHPGGAETCDAALIDEDCDGQVNEDPREAAGQAWPGAADPAWALVAGEAGWHTLVDEVDAWLGTPDDADYYQAPLAFPTSSATVVQVRVGPFDAGAMRRVCLFLGTPQGAPTVACQGLAVDANAPAPQAIGCCREVRAGGTVDVAGVVNLAGAQQATLVVLVAAGGGTCDAYRIQVATAQ